MDGPFRAAGCIHIRQLDAFHSGMRASCWCQLVLQLAKSLIASLHDFICIVRQQ